MKSQDYKSFFDTVYNLKTSYPDLYYKLSLKSETEEVINKYFASPILDYVDDNDFENAERLISQLESICHDPEEMEKINSIKFNVILSETLHSIKTSFFGNNASFHKAYSYLLNPNIYSVEVENRDKGFIFVYSDKDSQDYPFYLLVILDNKGTIKYINKLSLNPGHQNSDYLKLYIGLNSNDSTAYINSEYHEISKQLETIFDGYKILKDPSSYKLGLGIVYADSSSTTQAAYSATVAAVVVDENGVIVDCKIDCAQNKMNGDAVDPEKTIKSKYELGYDYNMVKFSEATNEWFQQADAFAQYVIGKTGEEVAALPTRVRGADEPHPGYVVTTDETLFASCSISIPDFKEAVAKAAADPYAQEFEGTSFTLGVACNSDASSSTAPADGKNGTIKMYVEFAAAAVDKDGKILATVTDAIQPSHEVDEFGEIVKNTYKGTKKELGFDYNMVKFSEATNEWFQQAAAFEDYCVGKTADEVLALPTRVRGADEPHPGYVVTTDETLFASCSISIPGFQSVIAKAAKNAR